MGVEIPRILIAGTHSGCGKTTVACGLLQALVNRGLRVASFKCGPDYIDPMFHRSVIGAQSYNLDPFFCEPETLRGLFVKNTAGADISVIEGVMGYYDGLALNGTRASTHEIAGLLDVPAVLIVNAKGAGYSTLAMIEGFLRFRSPSGIRGVILNQITESTYEALAPEITRAFGGDLRVYGYLPKLPADCVLESRHLGLVTADEVVGLKAKMATLAARIEERIDVEALLRAAAAASAITAPPLRARAMEAPIRVAVAMDRAFCFYYGDNLNLLREMGAEIVPFSPLTDARLPEPIHGLILGGGYPELYAETLSSNVSMRASIKAALEGGLPCIAECGGFMVLCREIEGHPMVGFFDGVCRNRGKLTRFGYIELTANRDNLLCRAGESIRGHEFHYYDSSDHGEDYAARKHSGAGWTCVHATNTVFAGFPHVHFYSNPKAAMRFYRACLEGKRDV